MSDKTEINELGRKARESLAEILIGLNQEYAHLTSGERETLKQNLLNLFEYVEGKYRLVKSGKATEEQLHDYLELYGDNGSFSYELMECIVDLIKKEDDTLKSANEVEALRNKKREFAIINLRSREFKDIHSDKCSVISSWLEALSYAEDNYSQFVNVSHQFSNVLVDMIFDESGFKEKRPAGKKKIRPRYSYEEIYAYDRKFGYKKTKDDLYISESKVKDSRAHIKNSYAEAQIEDDYLEWYMSILKKFMSQCEKEIEQYEHGLLWGKRSLSSEKIERINRDVLKNRKELKRLSTEIYKAAEERLDIFKKRIDTLKSRQSVK
ncbi:hypothetical protein SKP08_003608 [Vibrio fluvialis]|nr:hypothetical protein [Vibrio fluvialis]